MLQEITSIEAMKSSNADMTQKAQRKLFVTCNDGTAAPLQKRFVCFDQVIDGLR